MDENTNKEIPIKDFRNLKDSNFKFLEGKMNIILGKNNVGKSNLLDYINFWHIKNGTYDVFYLKERENFSKHLSSPVIFEVKKIFLLPVEKESKKERENDKQLFRFLTCNEHYVFEIETSIFGFKQKAILTKCFSKLSCKLDDWKKLCQDQENKEINYFDSHISLEEIEEILKESTYSLLDRILKNQEGINYQNFYGLGELLTHKVTQENKETHFEFRFSFIDPWDGKKKNCSEGTAKTIFLELIVKFMENTEKESLKIPIENTSKWKYDKWKLFFLSKKDNKKKLLLFDKPESSLSPDYSKKFFYSLKSLTEKSDDWTIIIVNDSHGWLANFASEIYDGKIRLVILKLWGNLLGKFLYLKELIDKIRDPILNHYAKYGESFKKESNEKDFYRVRWINILSKEYTFKLFLGKKLLFVEGTTELVFFSLVLGPSIKQLNKKFSEYLEKLNVEIEKLEKERSEDDVNEYNKERIELIRIKAWKEEFISRYPGFTNEEKFWSEVSEIDIIPIFGKYNYIFFAKLAEELYQGHKFVLDNDKEKKRENGPHENEVRNKKDFCVLNKISSTKEKDYIHAWEKSGLNWQEVQRAWNEGWNWPRDKFFYDAASNCLTHERKKCFCHNVSWIDNNIEKFLELEKKDFWKVGGTFRNKEMTIINNLPKIVENLSNPDEERWRKIFKVILEEWRWWNYLIFKK